MKTRCCLRRVMARASILLVCLWTSVSCENPLVSKARKRIEEYKAGQAEKTVTAFTFPAIVGLEVQIDQAANRILAILPAGAGTTNLIATFSVADGLAVSVGGVSQVSGVTANDFASGDLAYEVRAADASVRTYIVRARARLPSPLLREPANDGTVATLAPTFSWGTVAGAISYDLEVSPDPTFANGVISGSSTYPEEAFPGSTGKLLESGSTYYWRVRAVDPDGIKGAYSSASLFVVSIDAPGVPIVSGESPTNSARPEWRWTVPSGAVALRFQIDSETGIWTVIGTDVTGFSPAGGLAEGEHILYIQAQNELSDWSPSGTRVIRIDLSPPEPPMLSAASPTNAILPSWSIALPADASAWRCQVDAQSATGWLESSGSSSAVWTPATGLSEGTHSLYAQARDLAGNWSIVASKSIEIDLTPPLAPVVSGPTPTNDTTPLWQWTIPSSTFRLRCQVDGEDGPWIDLRGDPLTTSYAPTSSLTAGSHILYVQAGDLAGNWSASGSSTLIIDTKLPDAPTVSGDSPTKVLRPSWSWVSPAGTVEARCQLDGELGAWTSLPSASGGTWAPSADLSEGLHTLYVQARNAAGSWSPSGVRLVEIDVTPPSAPSVSGASPSSSPMPAWSWTVPATAVAMQRRLDGQAWVAISGLENPSWAPEAVLTEGTHLLELRAIDLAGNVSAVGSRQIVVDLTAPPPPSLSGTTPTNNTTPTWSWQASDDSVAVRYKLDSGQWYSVPWPASSYFCPSFSLSESPHTLYAEVVDSAGNVSAPASLAIVVDLTPPTSPTVSGASPTNDTTPTWSWTAPADATGFQYRLNSGSWNAASLSTVSFTPGSALPEATHILEVQARDAAGNWSSNSGGQGSKAIIVDVTAPGAPGVSGTSPTNDTTPTWSWTTSADTVGFRYKLDSGVWVQVGISSTSYTPSAALTEASHTLYVQAVDAAGNWSVNTGGSGTKAILVDVTPPASPTVTASTPTNDTTPSWSWSTPSGTASFRYQLDSGAWTSVGSSTTSYTPATALPLGSHSLGVVAVDAAGNPSSAASCAVLIVRAGTLDAAFGSGGIAKTTLSAGTDQINGIAVQSSGRIVACGFYTNGSYWNVALIGYLSSGVLDPTFGTGGVVRTSIGVGDCAANAVAIQPADDKIVIAGQCMNASDADFFVARYTTAGALDPTFGTGGVAITTIGVSTADIAHGVAIQSDGKIIAGGMSNNGTSLDFALVRYTSAGALDTGFGSGGKVVTPIGGGEDQANGVGIGGDGSIVLGGYASDGTDFDFAVAKYTSAGSLALFGSTGKTTTDFNAGKNYNDKALSVSVQANGYIVLAGYSSNGTNDDIALARYTTLGALDTNFGSSGLVRTPIAEGEQAKAICIQSNGAIVVAGSSAVGLYLDVALIRYTSGGVLDPDFHDDAHSDGISVVDVNGYMDYGTALTIQPSDGKYVVGGYYYNATTSNYDVCVLRFWP